MEIVPLLVEIHCMKLLSLPKKIISIFRFINKVILIIIIMATIYIFAHDLVFEEVLYPTIDTKIGDIVYKICQ